MNRPNSAISLNNYNSNNNNEIPHYLKPTTTSTTYETVGLEVQKKIRARSATNRPPFGVAKNVEHKDLVYVLSPTPEIKEEKRIGGFYLGPVANNDVYLGVRDVSPSKADKKNNKRPQSASPAINSPAKELNPQNPNSFSFPNLPNLKENENNNNGGNDVPKPALVNNLFAEPKIETPTNLLEKKDVAKELKQEKYTKTVPITAEVPVTKKTEVPPPPTPTKTTVVPSPADAKDANKPVIDSNLDPTKTIVSQAEKKENVVNIPTKPEEKKASVEVDSSNTKSNVY